MASLYGFNLTGSDMSSLLERIDKQQNGVRTWRQLFGNASLGYQAQSDALSSDYASAIAEAYKTNLAQRNAILGAGLSAGSTQQLLTQNRNDLHTAYETYVRNYGSAASSLAESYGKEIGEISAGLTERGDNFAELYNNAYKYLAEELYGTDYIKDNDLSWTSADYVNAEDAKSIYEAEVAAANSDPIALLEAFSKFYKSTSSETSSTVKSWNDLSHILFDTDDNLTMEGTKFFDQIFNATPQGYTRTDKDGNEVAVRSFDQWLSDTNPELRNWAVGADAFNYTRAGSNFGTAKVLAGMESDDYKYHQGEYLTESDVKDITTASTKSLSDAFTAYENAYAEFKSKAKPYQNYTVSPNGVYEAYDNYGKAWNEYLNDTSSKYSVVLNETKQLLLPEDYDEFVKNNTSLFAEYERLQTDAKAVSINRNNILEFPAENAKTTVDGYVKNFDDWFKKYNDALKTYIKKHGYTGKTSGF